nr:response regulator [uncultured Roseovarius sp.]
MKILAVDDDPLSLELLDALVSQIGPHELVTATSAVDALQCIAESSQDTFDCILLDIQMPGTNGIQLCEIVRAHPSYSRTPVLMITAMSDKKNIDDAFQAGATDYLTKPFEISELRGRIQMIERLLEERDLNARKISAQKAAEGNEPGKKIDLFDSVPIVEVAGVVEYNVLENYVAQISRKSLFGSSVFALKTVDFERLHQRSSATDLQFIITDVAEAISDALEGTTFLMAYAGNGTFVCVVEGGWRPETTKLVNEVHRILESMELYTTGGAPLQVELHPGPAIRLISRVGPRAVDALSEAQEEAEKSYEDSQRNPLGELYWNVSA